MARYGKPFRKKGKGGKFRKGTLVRYKYVRGRKVGAVKHRGGKSYGRKRYYKRW
jgi:hypothetical protein